MTRALIELGDAQTMVREGGQGGRARDQLPDAALEILADDLAIPPEGLPPGKGR